ncbi:MAG: Lrp/AsnC ligand binding domain-containing protein [Caldimicrobium sp.]|nr:Lrp/AsnC ligand binding domain-containing protein [Caldimicrobium sp.]MCX7874118.1 Lrp/AsnC ligand binding domain-containing protein [Caldimicrobium sp.]MDW8093747.1 Lrp/AsnC ligand binding domain-containing protein [Caldimicrobium sp.]
MSIRAYVLINTQIGQTQRVAEELKKISEVKKLDIIMGPYDIIVEIEVSNYDEISKLLLEKFQNIPAINHTMTCPVVS